MYENQCREATATCLQQIPEYKGMGCRRQSLILTFERSKFKLLEKIGVRASTSTKLRRRSCTIGALAREKAQSYPNCHTIINDATLIEIDIDAKLNNLTLLLHDEASRKMFRNFLKKEHSEENLDFWLAVNEYRQNDIIKAKFIYSKFLIPGATFEVNIDDQIRRQIRNKLAAGEASIDLFDDAKNAIFVLINRDSYKRFRAAHATTQLLS